ncbi:MAG: hypothetical protein CMH46_16680 [Muricauda sp.]|nr:hypothetical protein [Allomuricauda sp.]
MLGTLLKVVLLFILSFISWNYAGFLFLFFLSYFIWELDKKAIEKKFGSYVMSSLLFLSTWHFGALTWMIDVDMGLAGLVCNLVIYCIPLLLFYWVRSSSVGSVYAFLAIFLIFEFWLNSISFSYPWLTLGNVFSNQIFLVQWYEYTGVLGGSLWLLLLSTLGVGIINRKKKLLGFVVVFCVPVLFSLFLLVMKDYKEDKLVRIGTIDIEGAMKRVGDKEVAYHIYRSFKNERDLDAILIPELTFRGLDKEKVTSSFVYNQLKRLVKTGITKTVYFGSTLVDEKVNITNSLVILRAVDTDAPWIKNKSKLVPWNEYLPSSIARWFKKSFFANNVKDDFKAISESSLPIPFICYEIFYSFFSNENLNFGKPMVLLSSEEFLNNSYFGKKQYNNFLKVRAIETRAPLVKASNFGETCYIDAYGEMTLVDNEKFVFEFYDSVRNDGATMYNTIINNAGKSIFLFIFCLFLCIDVFIYKLFNRGSLNIHFHSIVKSLNDDPRQV